MTLVSFFFFNYYFVSIIFPFQNLIIKFPIEMYQGTAVAQWLRCCATNRKVAGSIPAGVSHKILRSQYGPGVDSASNRNEYQEYFLGVKATGA